MEICPNESYPQTQTQTQTKKSKKSPCPIACPPVISKTLKKNQRPAYDAFGPFPDETILSSVDRMLFFLGARRVQRFFNLPTPSVECSSSDCSITISHISFPDEHAPYRSCSTIVSETTCKGSPSRTISVTRKCCCAKCRSCASRTTVCTTTTTTTRPVVPLCPCPPKCCQCPAKSCSKRSSRSINKPSRVQICESKRTMSSSCGERASMRKITLPLKRSFSLCSLACRKAAAKTKPPSATKQGSPQWLWTRMQCYSDGSRIFEVFQKSNVCTKPSDLDDGAEGDQKLIFVVLPNGVIMPFETVSCHPRGESYVVFLDKQHRKDLQRQMSNIERAQATMMTTMTTSGDNGQIPLTATSTATTICSRANNTTNNDEDKTAGSFQTWINTNLNQQRTRSIHKNLRNRMCRSLHSLGKLLYNGPKSLSEYLVGLGSPIPSHHEELPRVTPPVFGPFVDESICATIDRLYYCLCLIFGRQLAALEIE